MLTMFNLAAYLFRHRAASLVRGTWRRLAWTLWLLATVLLCAPARDALAQAPAGKVYRIGLLSQGQPPKEFLDALQQGLRERGYVEGANLKWEFRVTDGSLEQLPQLAQDLVRLNVEVILARASSGALAAKAATMSIPIVFFAVYAPVEVGLVSNLARPGGNITGVAVNASDMAAKRVQLLKDLVPTLKRAAILSHAAHPTNAVQLQGAQSAARALAIQVKAVAVASADDFAPAVAALRDVQAVMHTDTPLFVTHRVRLVDAVAGGRLPAIYPARVFVDAGGLMSYGPNLPDVWRRAATYVDKILKGAKPGDLAVEQPTTFELVINKRTARALGLTIPPSLALRADQIIE